MNMFNRFWTQSVKSCVIRCSLSGNNTTVRNISRYNDSGAHGFLDKYNYVGNRGIYWSHPESSFKIRITNDFNQCMKGNQSNDNTCWWYFSDRCLSVMNEHFNAQEVIDLKHEIKNWSTIQSASEKSVHWATENSRFYASVRDVPDDQKLFAIKQYVATFFTDDAIEHLNSHPDFSCAADAFSNSLRKIWNGIYDECTDMTKFKGLNNIPDVYIENAIRVLDIQIELGQLAEKLLKPKVYELYKYNSQAYLDGCQRERPLFHKHFPNQTYISEEEGKNARMYSIGLQWILPTNMTDENSAIHLTHTNPAVLSSAWIVALENDVVGYNKDKNAEFCPMSFCRKLSESGKSDLEAVRTVINKTNEAKKAFDTIWNTVPDELSKHYEYLAQYVMGTTDWCFALGLQNGNHRYGWVPQLD